MSIGKIVGTHIMHGDIPCLSINSLYTQKECAMKGYLYRWGCNEFTFTKVDNFGDIPAKEAFGLTDEEYDMWLSKLQELKNTLDNGTKKS